MMLRSGNRSGKKVEDVLANMSLNEKSTTKPKAKKALFIEIENKENSPCLSLKKSIVNSGDEDEDEKALEWFVSAGNNTPKNTVAPAPETTAPESTAPLALSAPVETSPKRVPSEKYKERPPQSPREIERNKQRRKRGRHSNTTPTAKPFILVEKPPVVSATTQSRRKSAASFTISPPNNNKASPLTQPKIQNSISKAIASIGSSLGTNTQNDDLKQATVITFKHKKSKTNSVVARRLEKRAMLQKQKKQSILKQELEIKSKSKPQQKSKKAIMYSNTIPSKIDMKTSKPFQAANGHIDQLKKGVMFFSPGNGLGGSQHGNSTKFHSTTTPPVATATQKASTTLNIATTAATTPLSSSTSTVSPSSAERLGHELTIIKQAISEQQIQAEQVLAVKQVELEATQNVVVEKENEIESLELNLQEKEQAFETQSNELTELMDRLDVLEEEKQDTNDQLTIASAKVVQFETKLKEMKQTAEEETNQHKQNVLKVEYELGNVQADLESEKQAFSEHTSIHKTELQSAKTEKQRLNAANKELNDTMESLRLELKTKASTCTTESNRVTELQNQLITKTEELVEYKKSNKSFQKQLKHTQTEYQTCQESMKDLNQERLQEKQQYQEKVQKTKQKHAKDILKLRTTIENKDLEFAKNMESSSKVQQGNRAEINNLEQRIEQLTTSNTQQKETQHQHQQSFELQKSKFQTTFQEQEKTIAAMNQSTLQTKHTLQKLTQDKNTAEQALVQQQDVSDTLMDQKDQEIATLRKALSQSQKDQNNATTQAEELMQELQEDRAEMEASKDDELFSLRQKCEELSTTNKTLVLQNEAQFNELETLNKLQHQIQELDTRCHMYSEKIRTSEQLRRTLHNQVMDLRGSIRVGCRVRPCLLEDTKEEDASQAYTFPDVQFEQRQIDITVQQQRFDRTESKTHTFEFDRVFGPLSTQGQVYEEISHMVQSAVDGYNVCIFAYGQTGSGKTHTMMGGSASPLLGDERGMMPRAAEHIFSYCQELNEQGWTFQVTATMIEIYCEQIRDLTTSLGDSKTPRHKRSTSSSSCDLKHIRNSDGEWDTEITNANTLPMNSTEDVLQLLNNAMSERATAETNCNARSSRSHTVLTLRVEGVDRDGTTVRKGQLHLIDLAGSERLSISGSAKDPKLLKEAQSINKSLSCLGNVIGALARNRNGHIPYRDSKLTHLLQHSLGGDSKALMFCNVSPVARSLNESLTSLWFAEKVNKVARK